MWVYSRDVFCFNTNRPQEGWTRCPDMLNDRFEGKVAVVEGKIYMFWEALTLNMLHTCLRMG